MGVLKGARSATATASGTVVAIELSPLKDAATLWLGSRQVTIARAGKPIAISAGDRLLVAGTSNGENLHSGVYINQSNGDETVTEMRKSARKVIAFGAMTLLGALAVCTTVAFAAFKEAGLLSISGVARTAVYVISVAAALALGTVAIVALSAGMLRRFELQMIDSESHKSKQLL